MGHYPFAVALNSTLQVSATAAADVLSPANPKPSQAVALSMLTRPAQGRCHPPNRRGSLIMVRSASLVVNLETRGQLSRGATIQEDEKALFYLG